VETKSACRVLVVEDNADGRDVLRALLELLGHDVEVAVDGREGVSKALVFRPDIVLLDIGLPYLDGYQVARRLRAAFGEQIILIAQTGYGQPQDRLRSREAGFDAHLVKPIQLEDLTFWLARAGCRTGGRSAAQAECVT